MPAKLTEAQRRVLARIADGNPRHLTAWTLGTRTSEALRKRGFIEGDHPFTGRYGNDPILHITPAGRAALAALEPPHEAP